MNSLRRSKRRSAKLVFLKSSNIHTVHIYIHVCGSIFCVLLHVQDVSEFSIRVSFLELYNEELFDLLSPTEDPAAKLRIFEDSARKVRPPLLFLDHSIISSYPLTLPFVLMSVSLSLPLPSPGFSGHPRFGRATSSLQERGVLHPGTGTCQAADCLHPPQCPVVSLPLSVLCHSAHQGELHRGRGAAQDREAQPGTHSDTGCVWYYSLQVEDTCTYMVTSGHEPGSMSGSMAVG